MKPKSENVPQRVFNKETSVFKLWKNETKKQKALSLESDFALWKVPRIVKSESEIQAVKETIGRNSDFLKGLFIYAASSSLHPAISGEEIKSLMSKCNLYLGHEAFSVLFNSTNFSPPENPQF